MPVKHEVVKDRTTRNVARIVLDDGTDVHVKRIILRGHPIRRVLALFGRDAARREAARLRTLAAMGVPAPEVVSVGTQRSWGIPIEQVLTTRTLQGFAAVSLEESADPAFASALGSWVRFLHDRGVFHDDLHRGNVLRAADGTFALLDADRVRIHPSPAQKERRRGLLRVILSFRALREKSAWPAFLSAYGVEDSGVDPAGLARASDADMLRHLRLRSRRALRENLDFGSVVAGGLRWQIRKGFTPPVDPAAAINGAPVVLKRSRSSTVVLHGSDSVLKAFHPRRIASRLGNLWRGTRARRAFRQGHRLELLGIPTPRVLAFADGHQSLFASRSWLITELVPEATHATAFLASVTDPSRTDRFLRDVGALVGRLHRSGLAHRDLKGRNILRTVDDHAILVDLDGLKDQGCVSRAVQRRDLARLFRSAREVPQLEPRKARVFLRSYVRTLKWQDLGAAVALEGASLVDRPKGEHAYR